MKKMNFPVDQIKIVLGLVFLSALTGCVGYVDGGYGGAVVVAPPPPIFFGGFYEGGVVVHSESHRGFESRHR